MKIGLFFAAEPAHPEWVAPAVQRLREELVNLGQEVHLFSSGRLGFRSTHPVITPRRLRQQLAELDVVHSHTQSGVGRLAVWAARRWGIPHVHTQYSVPQQARLSPGGPPPEWRNSAPLAGFYSRCAAVTVESGPVRDALLRLGVRAPIHVLPLGLDLAALAGPVRYRLRAELGLPPGARVLLFAGRLISEANVSFLLSAFREVARRRPDAYLVLIGGGPAAEELAREANRLGIAPRVAFPGPVGRERRLDYLRQADLYLSVSGADPGGLELLEALAAGLPVVAACGPGSAWLLRDGENALCAPEDELVFAERVLAGLEDEGLRARLREGGLATAQAYSLQASARKLVELFQELRRG